MAMTKPRPEPELYHGVPVLEMHAGDPIPTPRAPIRYAVRVTPDLARWFLSLNIPNNRNVKPYAVVRFAADMLARLWMFTFEPIAFSTTGFLIEGQNRLLAVTECGEAVWFTVEFGWPEDVIKVINRGAARSNADALHMESVPSATTVSAIINLWHRWHTVRDQNPLRGFSGLPTPSSPSVLLVYRADPEGWSISARMGKRVYTTLDKALAPSWWGACHRLITEAHGREAADAFMTEVAEGTGAPRSATRALADFYRRRPITATATGDDREPIENMVRAWNAHRTGHSFSRVSRPGFSLTAVR